MTRAILASVLALTLCLAGCMVHVHRPPGPRKQPRHVHVHGHRCGHVWHGGRWVLVSGHIHGPACGHHYHAGRWQVEAPAHH